MPGATHRQVPRNERGAALIVCLTLLLVVTVTGLAAAGGSTLQLGMAGAVKTRHVAFQAAESALLEGERRIRNMAFGCGIDDVLPPDGDSHQLPVTDGGFVRIWDDGAEGIPDPWNAESWAQAQGYGHTLAGVSEAPRYTVAIDRIEPETDSIIFRVTAAAAVDGGARAVVQSRFRRSFTRTIRITGNDAVNVVAIGDGIVTARGAFGGTPDLDISLGGWVPDQCNDAGAPVTLAYQGTGGTDVVVVADVLGLGYAPGVSNLLDVTAQVLGLERALEAYRIERITVDNPGTTATVITTLDVSGRFMSDTEYCINTAAGETEDSVLDNVVTGLVGSLLPDTPLDTILEGVVNAGEALVGPSGLLPVLPLNASIIVDGGGNDRYDIHTDTTSAALVTADLGGDDRYRVRAMGDGFVELPVMVDVGGNDHYDIAGGNSIKASLDSGALASLDGLLGNGSLVGNLLGNLGAVVDLLADGSCNAGGLLGGLLCGVLSPLANLLDNILDTVSDLFDDQVEPGADNPLAYQQGRCDGVAPGRVSWRELMR